MNLTPALTLPENKVILVLHMAQAGTQSTYHCKHYCGQQEHKLVVAIDIRISSAMTVMVIIIIIALVKQRASVRHRTRGRHSAARLQCPRLTYHEHPAPVEYIHLIFLAQNHNVASKAYSNRQLTVSCELIRHWRHYERSKGQTNFFSLQMFFDDRSLPQHR